MASMQVDPKTVQQALEVIQTAFRQARPLILGRAGTASYTDKHDGSPVTDTDIEVEVAVKAAITRRFPDMAVFGEEAGYDVLPEVAWLIDPIDGTKSFIENVPTFTSMAVLIAHGEAIASVIYNISTDDMYVAQKGKGAYKNGVQLNLAVTKLPSVAYCKARFFDTLNSILQTKKVVCKNGPEGGGYGFTMVVDGLAAARFNLLSRGYIHDYAPGALLVREAGGVIISVQEDVYTYETRSFVACHPNLEALLGENILKLRKLENDLRGAE